MKYAWIIDKDRIGNGISVGIAGPADISEQLFNKLKSNVGDKFRMLDDDKNIYYEGRIIGNYNGFEPLDDFGQPNDGCVVIEYMKNSKWAPL